MDKQGDTKRDLSSHFISRGVENNQDPQSGRKRGPVGSKSASALGNVPIDAFVVFPLIVLGGSPVWLLVQFNPVQMASSPSHSGSVSNCWERARRPARLSRTQCFSNHQKTTFKDELCINVLIALISSSKRNNDVAATTTYSFKERSTL